MDQSGKAPRTMKAVILAGGLGTRISEETNVKPKPMIEIGGMPIIWHIMKNLSAYQINEFIICCGYKGYIIKEYFSNYFLHTSDVTFDFEADQTIIHSKKAEPWKVTLVDTGLNSLTGARLNTIKKYVCDQTFLMTYGDGVSNININQLIDSHKKSNKIATVTAVKPPGRFGRLTIGSMGNVSGFNEKPAGDGSWINGGFFILEHEALNYINDENVSWEDKPLRSLVADNQLNAYRHSDFWHPLDTLRDKESLNKLWQNNHAPWKNWE